MNLAEFEQAFEKFGPFEEGAEFAIACSGGVDSMALCHLMFQYAKKYNAHIVALIVNHNLRPESESEAERTHKNLSKLGIKSVILNWQHDEINANIQEQARLARYELLTEYCEKHAILRLLTAHHFNDELENYVIRKQKKSQLGLLSKNEFIYKQTLIFRPLTHFTKSQLIQYVSDNNLLITEDASNNKLIYTRNKIRSELEFDKIKHEFLNQQNKMVDEAQFLQKALIDFFDQAVTVSELGYAKIDISKFKIIDCDLQFYSLRHLLQLVSGNIKPVKAENILIKLKLLEQEQANFTIGGCYLFIKNQQIYIVRELSRHKKIEARKLTSNMVFASSYRVSIAKPVPDLNIDFVADNYDKALYQEINCKISKKIFSSLISIKNKQKIIAIPQLNYYAEEAKQLNLAEKLEISWQSNYLNMILTVPIKRLYD